MDEITVERHIAGTYIARGGEYGDGEGTLVQTDWDFPTLARDCGWDMRMVQVDSEHPCEHDSTDGTVTCHACGLTATDFISGAIDYLDSIAD